MPVLLSASEIKLDWSDMDNRVIKTKASRQAPRSSGVHLSGIIKYVLTTSGLLQPDDEADEMPLRMALGMAWEDWAVGLWPNLVWQPGEQCMDNVYGSPDGITPSSKKPTKTKTTTGALLEEFKATWKSVFTRQDITKERIWMWQLAGYCKMLGVTRARLHVFWVNGTYRPPSPRYMTYELEFSKEEIDKFWTNVVLKNRDKAKPETHETK